AHCFRPRRRCSSAAASSSRQCAGKRRANFARGAGRKAMPLALPQFTRYVFVVLAVLVLALLVFKLLPVLMLVFAGIVLASALSAGAEALERRLHLDRTWAVTIVFLAFIILVGAGLYFFGVQLAAQMEELVAAVTAAWQKVRAYMQGSRLLAPLL